MLSRWRTLMFFYTSPSNSQLRRTHRKLLKLCTLSLSLCCWVYFEGSSHWGEEWGIVGLIVKLYYNFNKIILRFRDHYKMWHSSKSRLDLTLTIIASLLLCSVFVYGLDQSFLTLLNTRHTYAILLNFATHTHSHWERFKFAHFRVTPVKKLWLR